MALSGYLKLELLQCCTTLFICLVFYAIVASSLWQYCIYTYVLYSCFNVLRRVLTRRISAQGRAVLVTGCDSGFGHDLSRRLDELGFTVFAGCLHPDGEGAKKLRDHSSQNLHVVAMDVGKDDSVRAARDYVIKHLPEAGLWGIVNNAGFSVMGDVEWLTINLYDKLMNVNFYGAVRTINNFLYLVRKTKGRIVNVTSVRGIISWPSISAYHATKHALETTTASLRMEMYKFGVKVATVRPGTYRYATAIRGQQHLDRYRAEAEEMWTKASDDVRVTYGREYLDGKIDAWANSSRDDGSLTTEPVVDAILDALASPCPLAEYTVDGLGSSWIDMSTTLARYHGFLPTCVIDWIVTKVTNCNRFPDYCHPKSD